MKKTSKKKITMEGLAGMVQRGFAETSTDIKILKKDMTILKSDVATLKEDVASLKENFRKILDALDKVAKHYAAYVEEIKLRDVEIERLKRWVEQIAQKVGVKLTD